MMTKLKKGISLIIHTKDEEKNIVACINSAKNIVDEIIVADMHSRDKTVALAKKAGARIVKLEDIGFADPARNSVIKKARYSWVLQLDADERLHSILAKKLRKTVDEDKYDVVIMPRKNIIFDKWIRHSGWWPDYQVKLVKKDKISWSDKVHTLPKYKGKVLRLPARKESAIIHRSHENVDAYLEKIERYTKHEDRLFGEKSLNPQKVISFIEEEFYGRYFEGLGFMDGMHGFMVSKFREYYRFVELARYWEKNKYPNFFPPQLFYKAVKDHYLDKGQNAEMQLMKKRVDELSNALNTIQSAKFYKLWQLYCGVRDRTLGRKKEKKQVETQSNIGNLEGGFDEGYRKFIDNKNLTKADSIFTHVTPEEKLTLYKLVRAKNGACVEIGSYLGASACFIAAAIRDKRLKGKLYCVDPWKDDPMAGERGTYEDFLFNTTEFKKYIYPLRGTSYQQGGKFTKKIDYLFIDGDHSYRAVKTDVKTWFPKLKKGGAIIFHDSGWAKGVQRVVEEINDQVKGGGRLHNLYWAYKK